MNFGPAEGGSHMGGAGATGAIDRYRQESTEGSTQPVRSTAREVAIIKQAKERETKGQAKKQEEAKNKDRIGGAKADEERQSELVGQVDRA